MTSVQHISSLRNSKVKMARSLKGKKGRREEKAFLVEGFRSVAEVIDADCDLRLVFVERSLLREDDRAGGLVERLAGRAPVFSTTERVVESVSDTQSPQGILAVVEQPLRPVSELLRQGRGALIAAAGIADPGNLGTIIRTAESFGLQGLVCFPGTVDLFNPKTVRSTAGAIFHLPLAVVDSVEEGIGPLRSADFRLVGTDPKEGVPLRQSDLQGPLVLFAGSEARGLSSSVKRHLDGFVSIAMPGDMESLNVAVAMGIIMYEVAAAKKLK